MEIIFTEVRTFRTTFKVAQFLQSLKGIFKPAEIVDHNLHFFTRKVQNMPSYKSVDSLDSGNSQKSENLRGQLGLGGLIFSVVALAAPLLVVVGLMPSMIGFAGHGIVMAFVVMTGILLLFSVGYTTVTKYVDRPGAFYTYITEGLGKKTGLGGAAVAIFGYLMLLLSTWIVFGIYGRRLMGETFNGPNLPWYFYSIIGVLLVGFFAYRQIEVSARVLGVALLLEVAIVVIFNVASFANGGPEGVPSEPATVAGWTSGNFGLALLFAALCFIGFESSAIYREEAKNPEKSVPLATYLSVGLIGVFYAVSAWALLTVLGKQGISTASEGNVTTLFTDISGQLLGAIVPDLINVLVVTSTFACLLSLHNTVARYAYSLGRDGVLPRRLGRAHTTHNSPYLASIIATTMEVFAVLFIATFTAFEQSGDVAFNVYIQANGLGATTIVFLMCLVSIAVLAYFRKNRQKLRLNIWVSAIAPIGGLIGLFTVLFLGILNLDALIGAGKNASLLMVLILPTVFMIAFVYAITLQKNKPTVYAKIGRE